MGAVRRWSGQRHNGTRQEEEGGPACRRAMGETRLNPLPLVDNVLEHR